LIESLNRLNLNSIKPLHQFKYAILIMLYFEGSFMKRRFFQHSNLKYQSFSTNFLNKLSKEYKYIDKMLNRFEQIILFEPL
jgi:hypothetical protein